LLSRYFGGSESAVRALFGKARRAAPSIVWLDEIDTLAPTRDEQADDGTGALGRRILSTLLAEMDGISGRDGVLVLAATSRLDLIDAALLRPGRFDRLLCVPLPGASDRCAVLRRCCARGAALDDGELETLVEATDGYSGAALVALHREAVFAALREHDAAAVPRATAALVLRARHFVGALNGAASAEPASSPQHANSLQLPTDINFSFC
jgi:SpoVK/Ycf46/Vps4 family AAA+-type ATPase